MTDPKQTPFFQPGLAEAVTETARAEMDRLYKETVITPIDPAKLMSGVSTESLVRAGEETVSREELERRQLESFGRAAAEEIAAQPIGIVTAGLSPALVAAQAQSIKLDEAVKNTQLPTVMISHATYEQLPPGPIPTEMPEISPGIPVYQNRFVQARLNPVFGWELYWGTPARWISVRSIHRAILAQIQDYFKEEEYFPRDLAAEVFGLLNFTISPEAIKNGQIDLAALQRMAAGERERQQAAGKKLTFTQQRKLAAGKVKRPKVLRQKRFGR